MRATYIQDVKEWVSGFSFSTKVRIRFSETDMFGHVNNTKVFAYFEYARIEYFKAMGFNFTGETEGQNMFVVADIQCDYLKEVFFDEELTIFVKTASIGTSSLDLHYMVKNEKDEVCYTGRGTLVQLNHNTGKGVPLLEEQKKLLLGK
ncbi:MULTISPECIES: acyl-CoA thioesterase [Solibacillus]|uniref:Acyl-CoA thioesterase n=1 Tax=Solibacillus merdavium TaxID=2762218 RepID=A0ABR8XJV8_9BACL|nr:thioesterase family protein [Solibacillus merdavium]MBD8032222.1 acyl-CoA thioesterase [Solibacillus merdavium]